MSLVFILSSCSRINQLTFPAHSLSYNQASPGITVHSRGINWARNGGNLSFTIQRPGNYRSGSVELKFFYQVVNDTAGTIMLTVTPVSFEHGMSFETYGSIGTGAINAPETVNTLYEQNITIESGNAFNPNAQWWYFEVSRQGTYQGEIRLMSIGINY